MGFFDVIGSVLTGGATGLIGIGVKKLFGYLEQKERNRHTVEVLREERENMRLEIDGKERVAVIEGETAATVASYNALSESMRADRATYSRRDSAWFVMVDVVRGITRPLITWCGLSVMVLFWFTEPALRPQVLSTWLYISTVAVLWWFGERPDKSQGKQ